MLLKDKLVEKANSNIVSAAISVREQTPAFIILTVGT